MELEKTSRTRTRRLNCSYPGSSPDAYLEGIMDFHALASLVPLLTGEKFQGLVENVRASRLREEMVVHEGKILDGRICYRACIEAGIEPRFRTIGDRASDGDDPRAFVISLNIMRRYLSESQRAMIAARLANLDEGRPSKTPAIVHAKGSAPDGLKRRTPEQQREKVKELHAAKTKPLPKGIKLTKGVGPKTTMWRVEDIFALIERLCAAGGGQ
jgi:hypothetical protein